MRYLVLSDIHANLEALDAVLASCAAHDRVLVLGDVVGYGADPNAVIERIKTLPVAAMIRGNHDKVAAGIDSVEGFNQIAREAIEWTATTLTPENRAWLSALPAGPVRIDDTVEICHGTPFDEDAYVFDDFDALRAIQAAGRPVCLFGHTHVPAVFRLIDGAAQLIGPSREPRFEFAIDGAPQYLANCGAVGQPRDGNHRAAYGFVDSDAGVVAIERVEYDLATAQAKIIQAGLPEILAKRLGLGR